MEVLCFDFLICVLCIVLIKSIDIKLKGFNKWFVIDIFVVNGNGKFLLRKVLG